jgi:NAD(P)-dependent dehydrogenase (short-subunit alcohol dehydrogenase family)
MRRLETCTPHFYASPSLKNRTNQTDRGKDPEELTRQFHLVMDTNVLSNIHLYNLFMPQILKGKVKKVVHISSGLGDMDWVNKYDLSSSALYSTSKAATNMIIAKFSAQYKKDGVLFLSMCPGMVEVGHFDFASSKIKPFPVHIRPESNMANVL